MPYPVRSFEAPVSAVLPGKNRAFCPAPSEAAPVESVKIAAGHFHQKKKAGLFTRPSSVQDPRIRTDSAQRCFKKAT
jgi:hypothetical protein